MEPLRRAAADAPFDLPDARRVLAIASGGEFDEFDLNAFFEASGTGSNSQFTHKSDVQKWLDIIRGGYPPKGSSQKTTECLMFP